jgi:hypothetical protein
MFAAFSGGTREATIYDNYKDAWRAGRAQNLPVLVVLNPGTDSDVASIDVEALRQSGHRRNLLANYVLAVIDTSTPDGEAAYKLFKSPTLPRVSVLDKQQKWQIYRTSDVLSAEDWNLILEKYRTGTRPTAPAAPKVCQT